MATVTLTGWVSYSDGSQQPFTQTWTIPGTLPDGATPTQAQVRYSSITQDPPPAPANFSLTPGQEFRADAWLYTKLAANAPLDPNSALISQTLVDGMHAAGGGTIAAVYEVPDYPLYVVGPNQPTVPVLVGVVNPDGTIFREPNQVDLQPGFLGVPMPDPTTFKPMDGTDKEAVIYQPSTHQMWEGWIWQTTGRTVVNSAGVTVPEWSIQWGGHEPDMPTSPGWWSPVLPTGAGQGAVAAGIPIGAFSLTVADIKRQAANHVLGLIIPTATNGYGFQSPPAQRTDGSQIGPQYPLEGMRFRLPANIDLNAFPATTWDGTSPKTVWRMVAEAMRDYGLVIYDQGANAIMIMEKGDTPQWSANPYLTDPVVQAAVNYSAGGDTYHVMTDFPWQHLQLLAPL